MAAAAVGATGVAFAVVVVVVAMDIGVEGQLSLRQCLSRGIRAAGHAAVEPDARLCQSHLGTAADAAADQGIHIQGVQNPGQRAVAAAVGVHHFRRHHLAVLDVIDLELLGVAKVLENFAVFISNCYTHGCFSFRFSVFFFQNLPIAGTVGAGFFSAAAQPVVSARDPQGDALHQHVRKLSPGIGVNLLDRGPGHLHPGGALLLGKSLPVNEPDGLVLL